MLALLALLAQQLVERRRAAQPLGGGGLARPAGTAALAVELELELAVPPIKVFIEVFILVVVLEVLEVLLIKREEEEEEGASSSSSSLNIFKVSTARGILTLTSF